MEVSAAQDSDITVVFEALGRALVVEPFLGNALLAGGALARLGHAAQRETVGRIMAGRCVAAFAHSEPESRYDLSRVAARAMREPGGWRLNGVKAVVQHAEAAELLVVSARTVGGIDELQGISLFVVPTHAEGVTLRGYPLIDGGRRLRPRETVRCLLQQVEPRP
jgi:alkylation response protein AidB-like acyl-CoA dehydrogenase